MRFARPIRAYGLVMQLEAAFDQDLRGWLGAIYGRLEQHVRHDSRTAVERVVDRQNRLLIVLVGLLGASIFAWPLVGAGAILGALLVLYLGTFVSLGFTALRIQALERSHDRLDLIDWQRERAWQHCPRLGPEERAQLVRIMNLSQLKPTSTTLAALADELAEARALPALSGWSALEDASVLLREPPPLPDDD